LSEQPQMRLYTDNVPSLQSSSLIDDDNVPYQDKDKQVGQSLESGIMNMHTFLKSLESKYIDLANFYKQELLVKKLRIDDIEEMRRIEAIKQEKIKLESQLKGLILLQGRMDSGDAIKIDAV
jgi:hypothetical protein